MKVSEVFRAATCSAVLAMILGTTFQAHAGAASPSRRAEAQPDGRAASRHVGSGGPRGFADATQPKVLGATYGEWAARWVAWAEAGPVGQNAITDESGQFCAANQPRSDVWFLAGNFGGESRRSCIVPGGRALFYPVLGVTWIDCPGTPDEALPDLEVREILVSILSPPAEPSSTLNGISIVSLRAPIVRAQTPVFRSVLPDNNVLDDSGTCGPVTLGGGKTGRRIADGYWVMLPSLPPGHHTLTLRGALPGFESVVTYQLHVTPR